MGSRHFKKLAFTLSEVLLVLSVIGVVAALTIPTLTQKMGSSQNTAKLKKTYSTLSQAFNQILLDDGGSTAGNSMLWGTNAMPSNVMNAFGTKMSFIKSCNGSGGGCWYTTAITHLNPSLGVWTSNPDSSTNAKAVLPDGTLLMIGTYANSCTSDYSTLNDGNPLDAKVCGLIRADVNGVGGPNTVGRDIFWFWITQSGIYPWGTSYETSVQYRATDCNPNDATNGQGYGCAGKILAEGTMND